MPALVHIFIITYDRCTVKPTVLYFTVFAARGYRRLGSFYAYHYPHDEVSGIAFRQLIEQVFFIGVPGDPHAVLFYKRKHRPVDMIGIAVIAVHITDGVFTLGYHGIGSLVVL